MIVIAAACSGAGSQSEVPDGEEAVTVTPENIHVVDSVNVASGPAIAGSLEPGVVSAIRAEIGGAVLETMAEEGQRVARGTVLARIDDSAIRDAFLSARSAATTAEQAAQVAKRNLERSERLAGAGAIAERELESARITAVTAESQLADAQARLAQAQKQLNATRITAPISGIVSERAVSAGDIVTPGMALFTVVDPRSLRLEASVASSELTSIRLGAPVEFTVTGYPGRIFRGELDRINPTVDPATGQVPVSASVPNLGGELVGGLFAQGRIGSQQRVALALPFSAVRITGSAASVLRIRNGVVESADVHVGLRDEQAEMYEIVSGVAIGDTVLVGAAQGFTPGTPVRVQTLDRAAGRNQP
jgi:RND family efflux transporter MFP subunit